MPSISEAGFRHAKYYLHVLDKAEKLYSQGGDLVRQGLLLFDQEFNNVETGQSWAVENRENILGARELCNDFPRTGALILDLRQTPESRIRWLEAGLSAAKLLGNRKSEASQLSNLGLVY